MGKNDNLKPWKPGQSGNPGGRPKKRPITDEYLQMSEEPLPEVIRKQINEKFGKDFLPEGTTWAKANALRRYMDSLLEGGHMSSKEIREAIEGKSPQRIELSGPEGKEIAPVLITQYVEINKDGETLKVTDAEDGNDNTDSGDGTTAIPDPLP